ncbi:MULTISPECIES: hypothetical protein [unclassified Sphingomonas]|uniref:hypothetical protein n=1 Tax=unclassified Sphingomonas TaxID=196159 RepID=UPI0006FD2ABD|nr:MULTISPECIES: hypothetical protein [unclassified Sphingomonas]KQM57817.1 hypothetical protein ASE65_11610 [Sphingomonas sp. Leaf16]KQN12896.1 hypothetical protein ASE81_06200 [Sphingomonas sp. Leaf29]KQN19784.1 hypothetical protein ASE83_06125 [Sphingomonas sp. Leaf32]
MSLLLMLAAMTAQAPVPTPPARKPPAERQCRKMPAPTGSRLGSVRECRTAEEWAAIDKEADRDLTDLRGRTARQN